MALRVFILALLGLTSQISAEETTWAETVGKIADKNPGLFTVIIASVVTPILVLGVTLWNQRRVKQIEIDGYRVKAEADLAAKRQHDQRESMAKVLGCLVSVINEVQQFQIRASISCVSPEKSNECIERFSAVIAKKQECIAELQLYIDTDVTEIVYRFFQNLGDMMVELRQLSEARRCDLSLVAIKSYHNKMVDDALACQEKIRQKRNDIIAKYNSLEAGAMRKCCGRTPTPKEASDYRAIIDQMNNMPTDVDPIAIPTKAN